MKLNIVVLGAGFGGLELSSLLSEAFGENLDLILIDKNDTFFFGFSKLDLMFGKKSSDSILLNYKDINKPGVRFRQEEILKIDPETRTVITNKNQYHPDILVIALGSNYDLAATPGLIEGGNEFYSFEGAKKLRSIIPTFTKGHAVIGVTSQPFKCPPAPSEVGLLLDEYLTNKGVRDACEISIVMPFHIPIPPSPETSISLLSTFKERGIKFIRNKTVTSLDPNRKVVILNDKTEIPYDLFLGIPKHRVPKVVEESGMTDDGWIPVEYKTLETFYPNIYAIGDVTSVGTAKAGIYAEGAAQTVAAKIIADYIGGDHPSDYAGAGTCYIEFGRNLVGRADVDFLSDITPFGKFFPPSDSLAKEKLQFELNRREKWFGVK